MSHFDKEVIKLRQAHCKTKMLDSVLLLIGAAVVYMLFASMPVDAAEAMLPDSVMAPRCAFVAELIGEPTEAYEYAFTGDITDDEWIHEQKFMVGFVTGVLTISKEMDAITLGKRLVNHRSCLRMFVVYGAPKHLRRLDAN